MVAISSSAPKNTLAASGRVDLLAEQALGLPFGDDVADEAEVLAQVRGREALHELGGLPQLDLKDDGEIAVAAEPAEVQRRDFAQPLERGRDLLSTLWRPSAIASFIVRSKIEMSRSSLPRKYR